MVGFGGPGSVFLSAVDVVKTLRCPIASAIRALTIGYSVLQNAAIQWHDKIPRSMDANVTMLYKARHGPRTKLVVCCPSMLPFVIIFHSSLAPHF